MDGLSKTHKQPLSCEFFKKKLEHFFTEDFQVTATIHTEIRIFMLHYFLIFECIHLIQFQAWVLKSPFILMTSLFVRFSLLIHRMSLIVLCLIIHI